MMTIREVNELPAERFVALFGGIAEHAPWVAEEAAAARPFADRDAMIAAFAAAIDAAGEGARLALLNAHPDLAGKAAVAGELTEDSTSEQTGVGLDRLSAEEFARFTRLNEAYRARFGIPFIFAVRGATKAEILASFEERIGREPAEEIATATAMVKRIIRFRIEDRIHDDRA